MNLHNIGLNKYERKIVSCIISFRAIKIKGISQKTGVAWVTINKHSKSLLDKGLIVKKQGTLFLSDEFEEVLLDEFDKCRQSNKSVNQIPIVECW